MTKIAAAAPLLAGMSAPTALAIGAALTAGSQILSAQNQKAHSKRQNRANQNWLSFQQSKDRQFEERDDEARRRAEASLEANLENAGGEARRDVIANEEDRLAEEFTKNLPEVADAIRGSGQDAGVSQVFDEELARRVAGATREAKDRMRAMARATAYGSGSMGGMGMTDMLRNLGTANELSGINDARRGDMGILRRYQTVEPEVLEYKQSPMVPILGTAGQMFFSGGAQNLGGMMGGAAPAGNVVSGFSPSAAAQGAGAALAPTASLRPVIRPMGGFL